MTTTFLKPVPGEWYFTINCRKCDLPVRFFPDENKGKIQISVQKKVKVHCPHCHAAGTYHTSEMTSTQEPETKAQHS